MIASEHPTWRVEGATPCGLLARLHDEVREAAAVVHALLIVLRAIGTFQCIIVYIKMFSSDSFARALALYSCSQRNDDNT